MVVNHPVRRRIIRDLILAGNIGLTSVLATLVVSTTQSEVPLHPLVVIAILIASTALVVYLFRIGWLQKALDKVIRRALEKAGLVRVLDYELLLRIQSGFCVSEIEIMAETPVVNRTLRESRPWDHGVIILAMKRNEETMPGIPGPDTTLLTGDVVTVYGQEHSVKRMLQPAATT